jgi:hypothetical protein
MSQADMKLHALGQQQWEAGHARHASGQSILAIAQELDIDCSTVRNCRSQPWPRGPSSALAETAVGAGQGRFASR